tara:strand:- start:1394 stop:3124 length:1731 start_codon:yes stop_codon:yes gene_type:complete
MSAIQKLLTDHMDVWASADTEKKSGRGRSSGNAASVYGIKKLRELILELAVRGKLVPQDPNDEPASELLKRIQAEKAKLDRDRTKRNLSPKMADVETVKIENMPLGWAHTSIGTIMISRDSERIPVSSEERSTRGKLYDYYGASGAIDKIDSYLFDKPLLLIGEDGANLINRSTPIAFIARGKYWVNNHAHVLDGINEVFLRYIEIHINAIDLKPYVTGTAQPKMNQAKMNSIPIFLPPLAEQPRIVAKVDELMALCDQLETQHINAAEAHEKLVSHLLGTLTQSQSAADFSENWRRIAVHFDTLFTTEASIDALKKTLLQLAVMGKLVPQDAEDEPASELLRRLSTEKTKLISEGKIKKERLWEPTLDREKPFELPKSWGWARFGNLIRTLTNGLYKPEKYYTDQGVISLRMFNIQDGFIDFDGVRRVEIDSDELEKYSLDADDLLINRVNSKELVGKTALIPAFPERLVFESMNMRARPYKDFVHSPFLNLYMQSSYVKGIIFSLSKEAISQASINQTQISSLLVPLPPIEEQRRIVTKTNELMVLCDQLKLSLTDANQLQQELADAIVGNAGF